MPKMKPISWYLLVSLQFSLHHLIALAKYLHLESPAGGSDTPYGLESVVVGVLQTDPRLVLAAFKAAWSTNNQQSPIIYPIAPNL